MRLVFTAWTVAEPVRQRRNRPEGRAWWSQCKFIVRNTYALVWLIRVFQSPGGSSSGSAIAVAAGLAPVALGTETEGSLISPATRQGLWTIKPTLGSVPNLGIMPVSVHFDIAGPICKTVEDTANLLSALTNTEKTPSEPGLLAAAKGTDGWKDLRIGALPPDSFKYDDAFQVPVPEAREQMVSLFYLGCGGFF
jgi:Asp-tRNA(Asn)/Glu-tRNA(Gln) amidotransferase A subunit family amidase